MTVSDPLPVNFTLSTAAKAGIEELRRDYNARFAPDVADVLTVGWGYALGTDPLSGNVAISFYSKAERDKIGRPVQEVSGIPFVFFTTDAFHPLFAGKVLDHEKGRGFFLRSP